MATSVLPTPVGPKRAITSVPCPSGIKPYPREVDSSGVHRSLTLLLTICLLPGSALAGPAFAKKHRASHRAKNAACQRLKGPDFAKAGSLKLVAKRVSAAETDLKGCRIGGE